MGTFTLRLPVLPFLQYCSIGKIMLTLFDILTIITVGLGIAAPSCDCVGDVYPQRGAGEIEARGILSSPCLTSLPTAPCHEPQLALGVRESV